MTFNIKEVKGLGRKEVHSADPSDLVSGGEHTHLYGTGEDSGKHASGWGRDAKSSRDAAYRDWDEKYR